MDMYKINGTMEMLRHAEMPNSREWADFMQAVGLIAKTGGEEDPFLLLVNAYLLGVIAGKREDRTRRKPLHRINGSMKSLKGFGINPDKWLSAGETMAAEDAYLQEYAKSGSHAGACAAVWIAARNKAAQWYEDHEE